MGLLDTVLNVMIFAFIGFLLFIFLKKEKD